MPQRRKNLNLDAVQAAAKGVSLAFGLSPQASDDVAQATAAIVLQKYSDRPSDELVLIAGAVARRVVLKLFEKQSRSRRAARLLGFSNPHGEERSTLDAMSEKESRSRLNQAMESLPEPDRDLLLWKFALGKTNEEVAAMLKCSVNAAKVRTSCAMAKLIKLIEKTDATRES